MKDKKMKMIQINQKLPRFGLVLTTVAIAGFVLVGPANAQYKPVGNDGITASPKIRARLDEKAALNAVPVTLAARGAMACAMCKDMYVSHRDMSARGANKPTITVAQHLCSSCETAIGVAGAGKAKHDVVSHTCMRCGAATLACCSTVEGTLTATRGVETKFDIAPIK